MGGGLRSASLFGEEEVGERGGRRGAGTQGEALKLAFCFRVHENGWSMTPEVRLVDEDGTLQVDVSGRVVEDPIDMRFVETSTGTIDESCIGSGGYTEPFPMPVSYYAPAEASELDLGLVHAGDVVQIRFVETDENGGASQVLGLDQLNTRIDDGQAYSVDTRDPFACDTGDPATHLDLSVDFEVLAYLQAAFTASKILPGSTSRISFETVDRLGQGVNKDPL